MATCVSVNERRRLVAPDASLSIVRQCELLDINRAGVYYEPKGETAFNLELMRKIDEQYTRTPFYGSRKMTEWLRRSQNYAVNRKRVQRLMRLMGIEAIYQKPSIRSHELAFQMTSTRSIRTFCGTFASNDRIKSGPPT